MLNGTTIITHGWVAPIGGGPTTWMNAMADAVQSRIGGGLSTAQYKLVLFGDKPASISGYSLIQESGHSAETATSGETIVKLDWSEMANGGVVGSDESTTFVGAYVADLLLDVLGVDFLSGAVHLIGHSRGASVNTALAERLAQHNVWIDQFTTLDPHPVDGIGGDDIVNWHDAPIQIWENVQFADNYYRKDGGLSVQQAADFDGESVAGAFNRDLSFDTFDEYSDLGQIVLDPPDLGYPLEHSDTHLWYQGTIDTSGPIEDGEESVPEGSGWYDGILGPRDQIGFYYSRIAGGNRSSAASGLILTSNRIAVSASGEQRSNLGGVLGMSSLSVAEGEDVTVSYRYQASQNVTMYFGYDSDRNPFNGKTRLLGRSMPPTSSGGGIDLGSAETQVLGTTAIPSDSYLYARIVDINFNERYVYSASPLTVTADPTPWHHVGQSFMAKNLVPGGSWYDVDQTTTFYQTDDYAFWWVEFVNLYEPFEFTAKWYRPDGSFHSQLTRTTEDPADFGYTYWTTYPTASGIAISGRSAASTPGEWRVEVSAVNPSTGNEEVFDIKSFTIFEDPAVDPNISHSHDSNSIDFTATDNTQLKNVSIEWNDGADHRQTWDDIYNGSITRSVGFNTGFSGTISYTITAEDTSGNSRAVSDSFFYGNLPPSTSALAATPDPVTQPHLLTLIATASDSDGSVERVAFYRDTNGNDQLDLAADELLGEDADAIGGWEIAIPTSALPIGSNRFFAIAEDDDGAWTPSASASSTVATISPLPPASADYDQDGDVDGGDFLAWQRGFGTAFPNANKSNGDSDNDLDVDAADLAVWQGQYGEIAVDINTGLVAYFPFNGDANEATGNSNDGIIQGAILTTDRFGQPDSAYYLSEGAYIEVPRSAAIEPAHELSISLWATLDYLSPGTIQNLILSKRLNTAEGFNSYIIGYSKAQDGATFYLNSGEGTLSPQPLTQQWTHIAGIYDGSYLKLYQDGNLVSQVPHTGDLVYSNLPLWIGTTGQWDQFWNGSVDEVRIYDRALSDADVAALASDTIQTSSSNVSLLAANAANSSDIEQVAADLAYASLAFQQSYRPLARSALLETRRPTPELELLAVERRHQLWSGAPDSTLSTVEAAPYVSREARVYDAPAIESLIDELFAEEDLIELL